MRMIVPVCVFLAGCFLFLFIGRIHLDSIVVTVPGNTVDVIGEMPAGQKIPVTIPKEIVNVSMQIAISLTILIASLFIILAKRFQPKDKHWAYGSIGTIIGFWLKQ